jgi:hypothetical protein
MGVIWNEDGYSWGTRLAAESLPLPLGRGITQRIAGTHTYAVAIDVTDEWESGERARRMQQNLPRFLENFEGIWAERREEVDAWWTHLRSVDLRSLEVPGVSAATSGRRASSTSARSRSTSRSCVRSSPTTSDEGRSASPRSGRTTFGQDERAVRCAAKAPGDARGLRRCPSSEGWVSA